MLCINKEFLFASLAFLLSLFIRIIRLIMDRPNKILEFIGGCIKDFLFLSDKLSKFFPQLNGKKSNKIALLTEIKEDYIKKGEFILEVKNNNPNDEESKALVDIKEAYNRYINIINNINA